MKTCLGKWWCTGRIDHFWMTRVFFFGGGGDVFWRNYSDMNQALVTIQVLGCLWLGFLYVFRLGKPSGNDSHTYLVIQNEWSFSCSVVPYLLHSPFIKVAVVVVVHESGLRYVYGANIIDNPAKIKPDSWVDPKKTACASGASRCGKRLRTELVGWKWAHQQQ